MGFEPFDPQGAAPVLSFLLIMGWCGVYGKIVSQPLLPALLWFPSGLLDVKELLFQFLVFFFPLEEMFSYISVDSMCPWEKASTQSYHAIILSQNSAFAFRIGFIFCYIQLRTGLSLQMMWSSPQ